RDNKTAHAIYDDLLAKKSSAEMQTEMERKQQGEQVKLLDPASLPMTPSYPVRWKFAVGGLGAGFVVGFCIAFLQELQDKALRNEGDVRAALELPMLASVPWANSETKAGNGPLVAGPSLLGKGGKLSAYHTRWQAERFQGKGF